MKRLGFLAGLAAGAGIMYVLDPRSGRRRRALVRDQMVSAGHSLDETASGKARFAKDKAYGLYAETKSVIGREQVDDHVLEDRVRSELGHVTDHVGTIHISARDGCITLHGSAPEAEVDKIVSAVGDVRGVDKVDNKLNPQEHMAGGR